MSGGSTMSGSKTYSANIGKEWKDDKGQFQKSSKVLESS
jgi:hypothetical protein